MTEKTAKPAHPCDVTVTVSGDRGSGKSYLIAVLAQALRGAGHTATTAENIPSALKAISDLSQPYNVTFVEGDPALREEAISTLNEAADEITRLREQNDELRAKNAHYGEKFTEFRENNIRVNNENDALREQVATLRVFNPDRAPSADAAQLINRAVIHIRDSVIIEQSRHDLSRQVDSLKAESVKLRNEAEAREREARALLVEAITGKRPAPITPASIQTERRAASRILSASDKLAIANGADPDQIGAGAAGHVIAASLDDHTLAVAENMAEAAEAGLREGTLASAIERSILAGGTAI